LDTVVFVKDGEIDTVYELELKVKVPTDIINKIPESRLVSPAIRSNDLTTPLITKLV